MDPETPPSEPDVRVVIVAEHASAKFGGEAILPLHYFRELRKLGVEAWLVVHERCRDELETLFPDDRDRMRFIADTRLHRGLWTVASRLPERLRHATAGLAMRLLTQRVAKREVRSLIKEHHVTVVHQPIPVSPKEPSLLFGLGVPVVMGPMNGGMDYPPAFRKDERLAVRTIRAVGRAVSQGVNLILPGKRYAKALLVANPRTGAALPRGVKGAVVELVENGVDLELWTGHDAAGDAAGPTRFVYLGRLVDWKYVDVLLEALARLEGQADAQLEVIGDGPLLGELKAQARSSGIADRVTFHGWVPQHEVGALLGACDVLVLSSVAECGGAVVLEAMACGKPAIATDWGGPADYLDASCGVLVAPDSREALVAGFAQAMLELAGDPQRRRTLGQRGAELIRERYNWVDKTRAVVGVYRDVMGRAKR